MNYWEKHKNIIFEVIPNTPLSLRAFKYNITITGASQYKFLLSKFPGLSFFKYEGSKKVKIQTLYIIYIQKI